MSDSLQESVERQGTAIRNDDKVNYRKSWRYVVVYIIHGALFAMITIFQLYVAVSNWSNNSTHTTRSPVQQPARTVQTTPVQQQSTAPSLPAGLPSQITVPSCSTEENVWSDVVSIPSRSAVRVSWGQADIKILNLSNGEWVSQANLDARGNIVAVKYCTIRPALADMNMFLTWEAL